MTSSRDLAKEVEEQGWRLDLMHPLILPASDHTENLATHPLFHEHVSERLHQRTNPILGPIGEMVVQHQPLPKQLPKYVVSNVRRQIQSGK